MVPGTHTLIPIDVSFLALGRRVVPLIKMILYPLVRQVSNTLLVWAVMLSN